MKRSKHTDAQTLLVIHLRELIKEQDWRGLSGDDSVLTEYQFINGRKFRFDVAIPDLMTGFECDGGMYSGGHRHGKAIERDHEKVNLAQFLGWKCFRFTNEQVLKGQAKEWLRKHL